MKSHLVAPRPRPHAPEASCHNRLLTANTRRTPKWRKDKKKEAKKKLKLLWISCGDSDRLITISKRTHDYLYKNDVPHVYYLEPGGHDFKVWKNGLYMFSQFLFKPVDVSSLTEYTILDTASVK
jgi:enterochelin esterase-like enzyme